MEKKIKNVTIPASTVRRIGIRLSIGFYIG